ISSSYRLHSVFFPFSLSCSGPPRDLHSFPTRRSSDLAMAAAVLQARRWSLDPGTCSCARPGCHTTSKRTNRRCCSAFRTAQCNRSEEHTSELQSLRHLVCRLLLEKKKNQQTNANSTDS